MRASALGRLVVVVLVGATCWRLPLVAMEPVAEAAPVAAASDHPLAELPFELCGGKIFVPVMVNGHGPYSFVFDTGCDSAMVDVNVAKAVGLTLGPRAWTTGAGTGSAELAHLDGVHLSLAGLDAGGPGGGCMALNSMLASTLGRRIDGLVGNDLADRYVVQVDYAARVLRLFDPETFEYRGSGASVPVRVRGHTYVEATVTPRAPDGGAAGPIRARFILDTGSRLGVSLSTPFVRAHALLAGPDRPYTAPVGRGIGGTVVHALARLDAFELGGFSVEDPVADLASETSGIFGGRGPDGVIGVRILQRFTVVLDYRRSRVILEPNAGFETPDRVDASGVWIEAEGPDLRRFVIADVADGSPAARARIWQGDEIVSVDGRVAADWTLDELTQLLREPGREVRMELKRGELSVLATFTLRTPV